MNLSRKPGSQEKGGAETNTSWFPGFLLQSKSASIGVPPARRTQDAHRHAKLVVQITRSKKTVQPPVPNREGG
jgi:hypothetical protein